MLTVGTARNRLPSAGRYERGLHGRAARKHTHRDVVFRPAAVDSLVALSIVSATETIFLWRTRAPVLSRLRVLARSSPPSLSVFAQSTYRNGQPESVFWHDRRRPAGRQDRHRSKCPLIVARTSVSSCSTTAYKRVLTVRRLWDGRPDTVFARLSNGSPRRVFAGVVLSSDRRLRVNQYGRALATLNCDGACMLFCRNARPTRRAEIRVVICENHVRVQYICAYTTTRLGGALASLVRLKSYGIEIVSTKQLVYVWLYLIMYLFVE